MSRADKAILREPFYFGLENERWEPVLSALIVPVPGDGRNVVVMRQKESGKFVVVTNGDWELIEHPLAAIARVAQIITSKGNRDANLSD